MHTVPYAKVLVKSETTPENTIFSIFAIFDLLYLNHNSPAAKNPVTHIRVTWAFTN